MTTFQSPCLATACRTFHKGISDFITLLNSFFSNVLREVYLRTLRIFSTAVINEGAMCEQGASTKQNLNFHWHSFSVLFFFFRSFELAVEHTLTSHIKAIASFVLKATQCNLHAHSTKLRPHRELFCDKDHQRVDYSHYTIHSPDWQQHKQNHPTHLTEFFHAKLPLPCFVPTTAGTCWCKQPLVAGDLPWHVSESVALAPQPDWKHLADSCAVRGSPVQTMGQAQNVLTNSPRLCGVLPLRVEPCYPFWESLHNCVCCCRALTDWT